MKNMFLGYVIERNREKEFPAVSAAGNNFQLGFIEAWKKQECLDVYSVVPIPSWPSSKKVYVSSKKTELLSHNEIKVIPFLNIKFLKELSIMLSVYRTIHTYCKNNRHEEINIISYNGNGQLSLPILWLRKKYRYSYVCMAVDPPLYQGTTNRKGKLWGMLYKLLTRSYITAVKQCDVCVVLNAFFAKEYIKRTDYYVLDCGVDLNAMYSETRKDDIYRDIDEKIHIVFTGVLHEHSGIIRFATMLQELQLSNVVLHIFGKGVLESQIRSIEKQDCNIKYHGFIPNSQIRAIQQQADILVCPNTIEHPINKVAFPSKVQEYMLSGVPVLATAVNGLGREYYDYLYIYDDTILGLKQALERIVCDSQEERKKKAMAAREFVIKEKSWDVQVKKLRKYMETKRAED